MVVSYLYLFLAVPRVGCGRAWYFFGSYSLAFSTYSLYNEFPLKILMKICDFQQCGILTSVDTDEATQPPFKLRNSK